MIFYHYYYENRIILYIIISQLTKLIIKMGLIKVPDVHL